MSVEDAARCAVPLSVEGHDAEVPLNITVFCDLDGPLINVSRRYYKTYQLALAETQAQGQWINLTPLSKSQFWQMKQERIPDADIAFCSGLRDGQIDVFLKKVLEIVNQPILLHEDQLQPEVKQSLVKLRQRGVHLSVVTLRCQAQAEQLLQHFHLAHYFDHICGAKDWSAAYQNYTEGKQAILEGLIHVSDTSKPCWIIGDTEADVLAGQALGLSTVALTCGMRSYQYLQRLEPTTVLPDLPTAVQYLLTTAK